MPNRILLIFITLLLGIGSASAQKYPERSLVRKGNRDFAKERYDRSIERYTQALEAAPENFEAAYNLGGALYRTEKYEEAAKSLQQVAAPTRNGPRLSTTSATPNSNRKNTRKRSKATRTPCG